MRRLLSARTKFGYGSAELGLSAVELMLQVYLLELYIVAGLSPFLAGLALAVAVLWDALSDPLMGVISDRTRARSPIGKRLPYFFVGSVILGVSVWFLFSPGEATAQWDLFFHLLVWYLILNTSMTLVAVPHLAMANDLGRSEEERTSLFGWRLGFGALGLLVGILVPVWLISSSGSNEGEQRLLEIREESGMWIGAFACGVCIFSGLAVWRALRQPRREDSRLATGCTLRSVFRIALKSGAMKSILLAFVFISIGRAFNSSLALVFYKGTLSFTEEQVGLVLIVLALAIVGAVPFWVGLAKRIEKAKLSLMALLGLSVLTAVSYPLLPESLVWPVMIVAIAGGGLVASIALLEAMFSDAVEDEQTVRKRALAGASFGLWRMSTKVARALGLLCSGWFLSAVGFEEGVLEQSEFVERSIAWAFGPGVAVFFGVGWWVLRRAKL